jgi:AraC family transcriptional regulator of adaptative response/methylated-DNA-[protein]-cysteine methyltransferase
MATQMTVEEQAAPQAISQIRRSEEQWEQVLARDPSAGFLYAVTTTGVYCRPSCSSRRPRREHVLFFATGEQAAAAGFRACLRCRPDGVQAEARIAAQLSRHLRANLDRPVPLSELAHLSGRTPANTQRLFVRMMGVSPRAFQRQLRAAAFREQLAAPGARITDAVYDAGFSSPSRAHAGAPLGMEPRQYRSGGTALEIRYAVERCPLGNVLVAATERGVCAVFLGDDEQQLRSELQARFPRAELLGETGPHLEAALSAVQAAMGEHPAARDLPLDLRGTAFQARVWEALRAIPPGETRSYAQVAQAIGAPSAVRAVAGACAANPVALVVPCHRVVGSDGKLTGYRWGVERKRVLLALERG